MRISVVEALVNIDESLKENVFNLIQNCMLEDDNEDVIEACIFALVNLSSIYAVIEIIEQNKNNIKLNEIFNNLLPQLQEGIDKEK